MNAVIGALRVQLGLDSAQFQRGVKNANVGMQRFGKDVASNNQAIAASFTRMASMARAALAGLVTGFVAGGVAGIAAQIGQVAKGIAQIGDEAKRAGVSLEAFQEWKFVAEQNRIGVDQMIDGLKELNLRADEFIQTGKGSAAEAFMRLGYNAEDLKKKLKNPSELLLEIIDRLGKFDKAAQIRISDELFGGSAGERFVELVDRGEAGIRATIEQAHRLGAVMDKEVIERAAELDRKFNAITATVSTGLKTAIVEAATALQDFINTFQGWWAQHEKRMRATELGRMAGEMVGNVPPRSGPPRTRTTPKTDRLPETEWTPPKPPPGGFGGGGGSARDKEAEAAERQAEAVRRLIAELEEELRLVGASDAEKEISATLRRANVDAASAEGQQIAALVTQIEAETAARQRQKEAVEQQKQAVENMFQMGEDALLAMLDNSQKAEDAIKRLAVQLALAAAQAALLGSGPLGGLFGGGLFGGPPILNSGGGFAGLIGYNANGTNSWRGGLTAINERGGEIIDLPKGSRVIPHDVSMAMARNAGGSQSMEVNVNVSGARGNSEIMDMVGAGVREGLRQYDREAGPSMVKRVVNDPRSVG